MISFRRPVLGAAFAGAAAAALFVTLPAHADEVGEGRPTAPVPVGPNITQVAPSNDTGSFVYEKARIKRTVSLDPTSGFSGKWDALFTVRDTTGGNEYGLRTTYLDWDDEYLYLAVEMPGPEQVRVDLDLADDGWLRGADNLSLVVTPPDEGAGAPRVAAQRFDMAQSRDLPVWAASPLPPGAIKVQAGRTPNGGYGVTLAIARTEVMGLERKPGEGFGIRVDAAPTLAPASGEATLIPVRPMMRVQLAESVEADSDDLTVKVSVDGPRNITPNGAVRATVEVKNNSKSVKRLSRVYLRGSLNGADWVDEQKFAGADIEPGKSFKRSVQSNVAPAAPFGSVVLRGGADVDNGPSLAALTSFNKVEPYELSFSVDPKPVPAGGENNTDPRRTASFTLRSRVNTKNTANIRLELPSGWKLESGTLDAQLTLNRDGQQGGLTWKFIIPKSAGVGTHKIGIVAEVAGRTYRDSGTITIVP